MAEPLMAAAVDLGFGLTDLAWSAVKRAGRPVARLAQTPTPSQFDRWPLDRLVQRGQRTRIATLTELRRGLDAVLPPVLDTVLSAVDLTDLVHRHVDIDQLITTVDINAIIDRIDLLGLADYIIDGVDLPDIMRRSSGSVTSEAVRGVRLQGIEADQAVSRIVDRLLLRRQGRGTGKALEPPAATNGGPPAPNGGAPGPPGDAAP